MNKAITDGLQLMPAQFSDGLTNWSSQDGLPGQATYDGATNAALVSGDQDFGDALELVKTASTQNLRYVGETPMLPGCYLRIRARVKAMSGNLPSVRIAGWAGSGSTTEVTGLVTTGAEVALTTYGDVIEVSAIVGSGARGGVDMPWGIVPVIGHFGLDLTGSNGGIVRVEDFVIEDITVAYLRDLMDWVDVRDFGAVGDGVTDDSAAFEAADMAAAGRSVLVPAGGYYLGDHVTMDNHVRFDGTVTMPTAKRLQLRKDFDLPNYADAFGDEVLAFKKAVQVLMNNSDHESLDMGGMRIDLLAPIDMAAAVDSPDTYEIRRVIRNGQFNCKASSGWDDGTATSTASYAAANPTTLTNVANITNIEVGSLVTGNGVGREVYVRAKNVGAGSLTLSQPLWGAPGNQSYSFTRFRYALDFSGFTKLSKLNLTDIELQMAGNCSGILLAPEGQTFFVKDCYFTKAKDRSITSIGDGCQGLHVDRCDFVSNESAIDATARISLGFNVNANDAKIRNNRFSRLGTSMVLDGSGHLLIGNHWFQGDNATASPRTAGLVLTKSNSKSVITGNYIDNNFIEWTNEHDEAPDFSSELSFGGLSIDGNIFTINDAASYSSFIVLKPFGAGHYVHGLNVSGNTFRSLNGNIDRVEIVDDSIAPLDYSRSRNVTFAGNTFNGITQITVNPAVLEFEQTVDAATWTLDPGAFLPFGGWARVVEAVTPKNPLSSGGATVYSAPSVTPLDGTAANRVKLGWPTPTSGKVMLSVRMDNPY